MHWKDSKVCLRCRQKKHRKTDYWRDGHRYCKECHTWSPRCGEKRNCFQRIKVPELGTILVPKRNYQTMVFGKLLI